MTESPAEEQLRRMLAERAEWAAPPEAPSDSIVRRGRAARRRRRVVLGGGLVVLAVLPGVAVAGYGPWQSQEESPPVAAPPGSGESSGEAAPTPARSESAPEGPGTPERQLLDGITLDEARASLERCLEARKDRPALPANEENAADPAPLDPASLRIVLAWEGAGSENLGAGPVRQVHAVTADPSAEPHTRLTCTDRPETAEHVGIQDESGGTRPPHRLVDADPKAKRHYAWPEAGHGGNPPHRWVHYGTVAHDIDRVTVTYGGETHEAVIEAGEFVAAGQLFEEPVSQPAIVGYDADGTVLYDSAAAPSVH